jgi:uncharacterized protein YeaO (DUF488 family)
MRLSVKRVYEPPEPGDGQRILVDRLWPRGIAKDKASIDLWLKAIAPSSALRKRFHAKPEMWQAFLAAYAAELAAPEAQDAIAELRRAMKRGRVTLLYGARDERHNNAVALQAWLNGSGKSR